MYQELKRIIEEFRKDTYNEKSRATDADILGIIVAQYLDWDGWQISQAYMSALEDSNFHSLNCKVADLLEREGFISGPVDDARDIKRNPTVVHKIG